MNISPHTTIGIAMSGGVDSSATALLLQEQYGTERLQGFFMRLAQPDFAKQLENVRAIAEKIGIPLHVIDLHEEFETLVLQYFTDNYFHGKTPNPCVICNRRIKFGLFLDAIFKTGVEMVATGHYARLLHANDSCHLFMGHDNLKDQSYFLARLEQKQLKHLLFPLGEMTKEEIYHFMEEKGFTEFRGKESQDVCFLENTTVGNFLASRKNTDFPKGNIVNQAGTVLGKHQGIHNYTIGQRKGLGISHPVPLYVTGIDAEKNIIVVGESEDLYTSEIDVEDLQWIAGSPPELSEPFLVRIRYAHKGAGANLFLDGEKGRLLFSEPQRAVTPGQFAVFYRGDELLGSGIIV